MLISMRKHIAVLIFLGLILPVFLADKYAGAFQAVILPPAINPGDAFIIRVEGAKTSQIPVAVLNNKPFHFGSCGEGCFVALGAVSIETESGILIIQLGVADKKTNLDLVIKRASFPEVNITLPDKKVFLNPEDLKRAKRDDAKLKSIWQITSDKLWSGDFILPLENDISSIFGSKRIINKKKISVHRGIDIKGKEGDEVKASNRGKVVLAEELFFGGNTIVLDHGHGIFTIYMHLSKFNIKPGAVVSKGDVIGFVGSTGRVTGPNLHFGVKLLNISTNPVSLAELAL